MKNQNLLLLLCGILIWVTTACRDALKDFNKIGNPSDLRYVAITDAREGESVSTAAPTVETGGLVPEFEIVSVRKGDGSLLGDAQLNYFSVGTASTVNIPIVDPPEDVVDENGNPVTKVEVYNLGSNGVISVAHGNDLLPDDYYFTIRVTTTAGETQYSTVFEDAFHLRVNPLLPSLIVYAPKNQNLVYGDSDGKTKAPIVPNGNPAIHFALGDHTDKLNIDAETGEISLASGYVYTERESLKPIIHVVSDISGEIAVFKDVVTVVITDTPETMPIETIYFFYPTLNTNSASPLGGDGYTVQTLDKGNSTRIWGASTANSSYNATLFEKPDFRPETNTAQTILETITAGQGGSINGITKGPFNTWMVTTTQDLTPFQYGYDLSFSFYYLLTFWQAMSDGTIPIDFEVYISTDYTGGDLQDAQGNWLNGTWTKVNAALRSSQSTSLTGVTWGGETVGMPVTGQVTNTHWLQCTYDISPEQISSHFTVAFRLTSLFEGNLSNNGATAGTEQGRGGRHYLTDFHYKAEESN